MNKRAAKKLVCLWLVSVIEAELMDGAQYKVADEAGTSSDADVGRFEEAFLEIQAKLKETGER